MMTVNSNDEWRLQIIQPKKYGQSIFGIFFLVAAVYVLHAFWVGDIAWEYVRANLFGKAVLKGLLGTIEMTILAMMVGIVLGTIAATMRMSDGLIVRNIAAGYIWLFRGTPALLQLLLWFNLALIFPTMSLFGYFPHRTVDLMTPFVAALLGLGIQQGAYTAEVVRAGLMSVDKGQIEAAQSIGMTKFQTLWQVLLPQAMRVIIPPVGNESIGMVKLTSLASVIQYSEILRSVEDVYYVNSRVIELLIVASIWYLVVVTVLSVLQIYIERYFSRGWVSRNKKTPMHVSVTINKEI